MFCSYAIPEEKEVDIIHKVFGACGEERPEELMERILLAGSIVAVDVMSDVDLHDEDDDDFIPLSPHSPLL